MTAEQLKNSILQEAFSGSLTHADTNLWERKKLRDISTKIVDGDHNPPKGQGQPTPYIMLSSQNINRSKLVAMHKVRYLSKENFDFCNKRTRLTKGDVLLTTVGTIGRSCVHCEDKVYCFQRSVTIITPTIDSHFLKYYFDSPCFQQLLSASSVGCAQKGFYLNKLKEVEVPIPPIEEQQRIVAKLNELLPIVEQYGKAQTELDELNASLPARLRQSILQQAIQGKLVPQDPNDEPASVLLSRLREERSEKIKAGKIRLSKPEKALKIEISNDFDLPSSWIWCVLNDVCRAFGRIGFRGYTKEDLVSTREQGAIAISPSNMENLRLNYNRCTYITEAKYLESPEIMVENGDILLTKTASVGKLALVENLPWKATINPQIAVLKEISIDRKFLTYVLASPYIQEVIHGFTIGTSIPTYSQEKMLGINIPLPPLAEQKRIVAKIEELLPLLMNGQVSVE